MVNKRIIVEEIEKYVTWNREKDSLYCLDGYFDPPLVGFVDARDPLFEQYKTIVGNFHLTPQEFYDYDYGPGSFTGGTVVSWVLPVKKDIVKKNAKESFMPSREWVYTRYGGEKLNEELRKHMSDFLKERGYKATAPVLSKKWQKYSQGIFASSWSERHVAFAAGLGTFGLSNNLITEKGCAHRCGSIITELVIEPTERRYKGPFDYCLAYNSNSCGVCMTRCPAKSITQKGNVKSKCSEHQRQIESAIGRKYSVDISTCGLCQSKVPCSYRIPKQK